jgi:hypothetical protein
VTVTQLIAEDGGGVEARLEWAAAPELRFRLRFDDRGHLVEYCAAPIDGERIASRRLRVAPIGEMERAARAFAADSVPAVEQARVTAAERRRMLKAISPVVGGRSGGDERLATICRLYVDLLARGDDHPVQSLAAQMHLGEKTVRNLLYRAREAGLLTSPGRGRAGGELTDKAKEILDGER